MKDKNGSKLQSEWFEMSLYVVVAVLLMVMSSVAFLIIQNHGYELLSALTLRYLFLIIVLIHIVSFPLTIYRRKQFVHISALDAAHVALAREQMDRENILDAIPVGVAITSCDDGRILWCNQLMGERLRTAQEALIGQPISAVYQSYTPEKCARLLEQVKGGQSVRGLEMSYVDAAGAVGHTIGSVYAIEYQGKCALLMMLRDVTDVRNAKKAVEQSNNAGVIVGKIVHDFNDLLTEMKLQMVAGIRKLGSEHPAETYFQQASGSVKEAAELVNELHTDAAQGKVDRADDIAHDFNNLLTVMKLQLRVGVQKLGTDHPAERCFQQTIVTVKEAAELVKQLYHSALSDNTHQAEH